MRVQMIVNPRSGRGRGAVAARVAEAEFRRAGWLTEVAYTAAAGHATELARAVGPECDLIVACGGDGTLCEVLNGLLDPELPVGFIPAGTGNDFVRSVGLPLAPAAAARAIVRGRPEPMDLMRLDHPAMVAINIIGIGFDAAVAARMNRHTRFGGGALSYLSAVLMELAYMKPVRLRLQVDGEPWEGEALLVAVANAQSYGGGMRVAPDADLHDGLADVVIVEPLGLLDFLRTLPKVFKGTHMTHPQVSCRRGREIIVESDEVVPVMVDGDLKATAPLRVTVAPGAARLWLPERPG